VISFVEKVRYSFISSEEVFKTDKNRVFQKILNNVADLFATNSPLKQINECRFTSSDDEVCWNKAKSVSFPACPGLFVPRWHWGPLGVRLPPL